MPARRSADGQARLDEERGRGARSQRTARSRRSRPPTGRATVYNQAMALAVLYLILALVVFLGATVVAVAIMLRVQARRGEVKKSGVDEATVAMLRRRRYRLDRRLGIDPDTDPEATPTAMAEAGGDSGGEGDTGRSA